MTAVPKALDRRFREAATEAGLVDVSFDVADTQIGPLLLAVTERGLCRISFDPEPDRETETLARTFGVRVLRAPRELDPVRRELDEYFEAAAATSTCRSTSAAARASRATSSSAREGAVRRGHDLQVARRRGRQPPRGPRGRDDHESQPDPDRAPCHRVVGSRQREPRRLRRRTRAETAAPRPRGGNAEASTSADRKPTLTVSRKLTQ